MLAGSAETSASGDGAIEVGDAGEQFVGQGHAAGDLVVDLVLLIDQIGPHPLHELGELVALLDDDGAGLGLVGALGPGVEEVEQALERSLSPSSPSEASTCARMSDWAWLCAGPRSRPERRDCRAASIWRRTSVT